MVRRGKKASSTLTAETTDKGAHFDVTNGGIDATGNRGVANGWLKLLYKYKYLTKLILLFL